MSAAPKRPARAKAAPAVTPEAAPTASIITLPLFALVLSGLNVRQTERDADIAALADDIAARGLKQNLVVVPAHFSTADPDGDRRHGAVGDISPVDQYEVIAGGRRYQALQLLAQRGDLPHDHPVPCLLEDRSEARETSLSENLHRVAMNPADEFEAFAAIVSAQGGGSAAEALCAKRFGVSQRHVAERLRLAALAPELLAALRTGEIGVDSAKAYAITADHDAQRAVFAAQGKSNFKPHDPRTVRDALRGRSLGLDDRLVKFAGLDAYRAAGGRTETEMFMGSEGGERLLDVALVERLAQARGESLLAEQIAAQGWAGARFTPSAWQIRAPDGFKRTWESDPAHIPAADRARQIGLYTIADEADGLRYVESFKPLDTAAPADEAPPAHPSWTPPTPEERAARQREEEVLLWSARLALGSFDGSPLQGRAFWYASPPRAIEFVWPEGELDTGEDDIEPLAYRVACVVEVPAADLPQFRDAAEAKVDAIIAEIARRRAERDAEIEARMVEEEADEADEDENEDGAEDDE